MMLKKRLDLLKYRFEKIDNENVLSFKIPWSYYFLGASACLQRWLGSGHNKPEAHSIPSE